MNCEQPLNPNCVLHHLKMLLWSVILFNLILGGGVFLQEVNSQGHHQSSIPYHLRPYFEVKDSAGQLHKNGLNEDWSDTSGRKGIAFVLFSL